MVRGRVRPGCRTAVELRGPRRSTRDIAGGRRAGRQWSAGRRSWDLLDGGVDGGRFRSHGAGRVWRELDGAEPTPEDEVVGAFDHSGDEERRSQRDRLAGTGKRRAEGPD